MLPEYDSMRRLTDRRETGLNLEPASRASNQRVLLWEFSTHWKIRRH